LNFRKVGLGEHGKRAAPKAAARKGTAAGAGAPHGGHSRTATVTHDRSRRWGPLTAETAIVLGVAAAIVAGAFMVETIQPASQRTNTSVGPETIVEHQLGQGGIKPGALQPRTIVRPTLKPTTPTALPTSTAKPGKTPKPGKTVEPTTDPGDGGVITDPGTGGGSTCTPIPLIRTCPDEPVKSPDPKPTTDPEPEEPPADSEPEPSPDPTQASTQNATAKNKKKPIPPPTEESESAASR
jgi:hypothetical protein